MKDTITQQFDDKDIECVNVLRGAGYGLCAAKVIVALIGGGKTQHELTVCTGENQSAVSVTVRKLKSIKAVDVSELERTEGRGRPKHVYRLISWDAIVDMVERKTIQEIEDKKAQISKLKELVD
jgi:predicted transcriptional regulator